MDLNLDEFDESEVMFSDYSSDQSVESNDNENGDRRLKHYNQSDGRKSSVLKRRKSLNKIPKAAIRSSLPMNIPTGIRSLRYDGYGSDMESFELFDQVIDEDDMMRMPPHLIVDRRVNEEIARSFSPIKGKNLCQVRNSILKITGFYEGC